MRRTLRGLADDLIFGVSVAGLVVIAVVWVGARTSFESRSFASSAGVSGYTALAHRDPPTTWPCNAELEVAVHLGRVPEPQRQRLLDDIDTSLSAITAASPYTLVRTRSLTEIPNGANLQAVAIAAGVDLVIAVDDHTKPQSTDLLTPGSYGTGGHFFNDSHAFVGWALIDVKAVNELTFGGGPQSLQTLILHEVLHALGLGHNDARASVMQPDLSGPTGRLGDVDIAGLGRLNTLACGQ
ncbi:MAG: matrixin family metalloprotease [Actinomycetota bacterium]|nr:matrixin family metalloprotease [Actinomycetota bacterium]